MQTNKRIELRHGEEWATFHITENMDLSDQRTHYSAEMTIHSSYGGFSHYWNSMGKPFEEFAKTLDQQYILNKISNRIFDKNTYIQQVKNIITNHPTASKEYQATMLKKFRELCDQFNGDILVYETQNDETISDIITQYDIDGRIWSQRADDFLDKFWEPFIKSYPTAPALVTTQVGTQVIQNNESKLEKYEKALKYIATRQIKDSFMEAKEFQRVAQEAMKE